MASNKRNVNNESSRTERNYAHKKLRKLPHVFSKVLELPFGSDADVAVEEGPEFFRFSAEIEVDADDDDDVAAVGDDMRAHAVEIHPGVVKIVVRNNSQNKIKGGGGGGDESKMELLLDKLEVDTWRFRLPSSSRPELATAVFVDGELSVTVPKGGPRRGVVEGAEIWGCGISKLVLAQ
ncbi:hypothetical protein ABFS82_07G032600 [Erythranthe guttata]|uniref:SHSP domain-containing protein n=1 Tax=Erythranthe guttata TaxID=4155 RepID=A0A022RND5_ERYGU|nr:PREDICTED: uncharacterized protein LOC105953316 [Erythranthe guttata]EYU41476.1 hypothetical protein MIMGU_mgv1a020098mg [Erythranthe guttata]|eukprot:XP_012832433.1 PREDICTED: uncharacterized protein LOC105953316 [Erythranthe guttata]